MYSIVAVYFVAEKYMRTLIILLILVVIIVVVVLWMFFKDESKNIFNFLKKEQKSPDHHHKIDTKYFEEGLEHVEFHHKELKYLKEAVHTHII